MTDDEILQGPIEKLRSGDLDGALADLDEMMGVHKTNAEVHHMFAEFANMKNAEAQDDVIPGGKIRENSLKMPKSEVCANVRKRVFKLSNH